MKRIDLAMHFSFEDQAQAWEGSLSAKANSRGEWAQQAGIFLRIVSNA